jgi:hypothetical protein
MDRRMTSIVTDFKSIRRKLERQEQKAEYEAKNPKVEPSMYGWPYGVAVPFSPAAFNEAARKFMAGSSNGFNLPDLRGRVKANG